MGGIFEAFSNATPASWAAAERASLCFKKKGNTDHQIIPWLWHNDAISMICI